MISSPPVTLKTVCFVAALGWAVLASAQSPQTGKTDAPVVATQQQTGGQPLPDSIRYRIFFRHVSGLQQLADSREKAGNAKAAAGWRTHDQRLAGLDDAEGAVLKQVAENCNQAIQKQEAQAKAIISKIPAEELKARPLDGATLSVLKGFRLERDQIVQSHIDSLKSTLSETSFLKLDAYVSDLLKSSVTTLVSPPHRGSKIDTRDTLRRAANGGAQ